MATEPLHEIAREIDAHRANAQARADMRTLIESIVLSGDIGALTHDERVRIMERLCVGMGLDPATGPIAIIETEDGREQFYLKGTGTDALAERHGVVQKCIEKPAIMDLGDGHRAFVARWSAAVGGREIDEIGAVPVPQTSWDTRALCNAMMHANTKARRRATKAVLGVGLLDESELDTMRVRGEGRGGASRMRVAPTGPVAAANEAPAAEEPEPTALDRLHDDLSQLDGVLSVEQLATLWLDHSKSLPVDDAERARDMLLARGRAGLSRHALNVAVRLAEGCEREPVLKTLRAALAAACTADELVATVLAHRAAIATIDEYSRTLATDLQERRVRELDPAIKQPGVWLRHAIASAAPRTEEAGATPATANDAKQLTGPAPTHGAVLRIQHRAPRV